MKVLPRFPVVKWRVNKLKPHPAQARVYQDLGEAELQALADDIQANGLRVPIEITPDGVVICGHQRLAAVKLLGWTTVSCVVRKDLADQGPEAVERRLIEDNLIRRNLGRLGILRAVKALMSLTDKEQIRGTTLRDYVAKWFNLSGRTIDRQLKFLEAPVPVQEAWERRQLTDGDMRLVLEASPRRQKQIADQIQAGKQPKELVRELADKRPRPTPGVESRVAQVVVAIANLKAVLPRDEREWPVEAWREAVPQIRQGRMLLRRLCDRAQEEQAAPADR